MSEPTELVSVKSSLNPTTASDENYCCLGEAEYLGILLEHVYIYIYQLSIQEDGVCTNPL